MEQLTGAMAGIEWRSSNAEAFLDEIPGAYKDIDQVMEDAKDLVRVDHTLRRILNVKGDRPGRVPVMRRWAHGTYRGDPRRRDRT